MPSYENKHSVNHFAIKLEVNKQDIPPEVAERFHHSFVFRRSRIPIHMLGTNLLRKLVAK
jgi:hypothetical protein